MQWNMGNDGVGARCGGLTYHPDAVGGCQEGFLEEAGWAMTSLQLRNRHWEARSDVARLMVWVRLAESRVRAVSC